MKPSRMPLAIAFLFLRCTIAYDEANPAVDIVKKSIQAHGGRDAWVNARKIKYRKQTILFDSLGRVESDLIQYHQYTLRPELEGTISWNEGDDSHIVIYSNNKREKRVNAVLLDTPEDSARATKLMQSSYYVLFQPFKLLDENTTLIYQGTETWDDGRTVDVVRVKYAPGEPDEPGADRWWYFFDVETGKCVANMVDHEGRFSLIQNLEYDTSTALVFNHHRKSYFVDSLKNIRYLRAEYFYDRFVLE